MGENKFKQLTFERETANAYQKIWNLNGGIQVQNIEIIHYNDNDEKITTSQYYFIDSRNAI
jgi:hypothetical protein